MLPWRNMIARIAYALLLAAPLVAQAQPAPAQITLEEAVRRALSRNPSVGVAVAEIQRAHALMREVRSFALPTIIGTGVATRLDSARRQGTTVVQPRDSLTGDIAFTVPLVAPQRWVNWSHAAEQVDVARFSAEDVRRQIAVSTARAYVTVLGQHRLVQANRLARDNAKDHLVYARARLEAGTGNRLDAVRSAQDLASNEAQLANALVNLSRAQEALSVLVGADGPLDAREDVEPPAGGRERPLALGGAAGRPAGGEDGSSRPGRPKRMPCTSPRSTAPICAPPAAASTPPNTSCATAMPTICRSSARS